MKVAIDISPLKSAHQFRGIGVYTKNLIGALQKVSAADFQLELIEENIPEDVDLVHYPYFDFFFLTLPLRKVRKTVVTIHDVIPLLFPAQYPPGIKGKIRFGIQKFSLRKVEAVICDSEASKKDIFKYLNYPEEKIFVIYLAPDEKFRLIKSTQILQGIREKYRLPKEFILYLGDVNYNKNILGLVKACQKIKIPLVIVGKQAIQKDFDRSHIENQPLVELLEKYGKDDDILRLGYVPDQDLVAIFNLATVYCQPSFYEGFGLPVLEAMACGTPVVAAKTGSLPEICSQAAVMVDPYDVDDLAKGLKAVVQDKGLQKKLVKKGFFQVKKFSWQKTADETFKVYSKICG